MDKLTKECVLLYKDGASRMDVARLISEETGLKATQSKVKAKKIWDEHFTEKEKETTSQNEFEFFDDETISANNAYFEQLDKNSSFVEDNDTAILTVNSKTIRTIEELVAECQIDLDKWEIERGQANKWDMPRKKKSENLVFSNGKIDGYKIDTGEFHVEQMFQVKVWFKRKQTDKLKEVIEFFKTELQKVTPKFQQKHKPKGKYLYEISIPDLHLSKLPTQGLWDACEEFKNAVSDLISRVDLDEIEKIVLPIGNDFFNSEGMRSSTTAGTPQKDAHPWQKSFKVGCQLITDVVDQLAQRVNIDIVIVSGNHDFERCFYLGEYLGAWYRKNEAVTVNNGEENRKYYTYGKNLIMWTHGSEEKQTDIPLLMARESKNWSACKYYFAHLGHFHHDWLRDMKGIKVRVLPSLCPPDFWHSSKGYLGSTRSALGFLYDSEKGEVANYYYNL